MYIVFIRSMSKHRKVSVYRQLPICDDNTREARVYEVAAFLSDVML